MTDEFMVAVSPLLKVKVELGERELCWKLGLRRRVTVPLEDVAKFGHRRLSNGTSGVVELIFVSKSGAKLPKLPMNPADTGAKRLLDALAKRLPDADVSRLSWIEAAPLLGMKPYGVGAYLRYPLFAAGLALFALGAPASQLSRRMFSSVQQYQGIVVAIVMTIGVAMMIVGWRRVKADQRAEVEAAKRMMM